MKTTITGAFSYSGKYIAHRLLARGDQVVTLTNHPGRGDPFDGRVRAFPLEFADERGLREALRGVEVLFNTYWVRFDRRANTQPRAVENTRRLVRAAVDAGVRRILHISIANPSIESHLPYYWGKAANEQTVMDSGLSYAILRPTVLFGKEDILINNIAWLLRRFPIFAVPGRGGYRLQPVSVEDLADLAVEAADRSDDVIWDAVGPEVFSFRELVDLIARTIGSTRPLVSIPPKLALLAARVIGLFVGDVVLTPEEIDGLMAELLVSKEPPRCRSRLSEWLAANRQIVGAQYASELARHYRP